MRHPRCMATGSGITEPVPRLLQRVLRSAVLDHVRSEPRRTHPPVLHVGFPGRAAGRFEVRPDDVLDHALRVEVVEAMTRSCLERGVVPLLWLTRPVDGHDVEDLAWAAAVAAAAGELGVTLDLVVVTRRWWRDPRTGVGRTWKRLRPTAASGSP